MSLRIKQILQNFLSLIVLLAFTSGRPAAADVYDQFRLIGDHAGNTTGFVTSISFHRDQNIATILYVDVAGGSNELTVTLSPSSSIQSVLPVFLPPPDFLQPPPLSLDLSGIEFLQGRIASNNGSPPPPHWFRLTYHDERWSGVFRVDNRIYSIDRYAVDTTVKVRSAKHGDLDFLPNSRVKVSAVIDELYVQPDATGDLLGMENLGHLFALESVHILDGLLSDSLGITVWLEQLIYQPSTALSDVLSPDHLLDNAEKWSDRNADAFGLTDNLAIMFFRGSPSQSTPGFTLNDRTNDHIAVIANTQHYQFTTAHAFGLTLGLPFEDKTIQHWQNGNTDVLPDVLWSPSQKQFLENHPLPESLVQTISYDAPQIADPTGDQPASAVDEDLVVAEQPESGEIFDDDDATVGTSDNGTGAFAPVALLLALWLQRFQRRYAHKTNQ